MDWEPEAVQALDKAPRFVRGLARSRVEKITAAEGRTRVTLADVEAARKKMGPAASKLGSASSLDEKQIIELEKRVEELQSQPALQTRYYSIRVCGAVAGCPRTRVDIASLAEGPQQILDGSGLGRHLEERIRGPILTHSKFRLALSGCPNACSQPQIVDFGIIGQARPGRGQAKCTGCEACVQICSEKSIRLVDGQPHIDRGSCIDCGDCAEVCPANALTITETGYSVLVGGRLGRHPRLAKTLLEFVSAEEVEQALAASLDFYINEAEGPEKFSLLIERKGLDSVLTKR